ncbi:MAG TPA: hypothetical protein VFR02_07380, partial [bacterium]|nr:hypothetical protein [bacterium]
MKTPIRLALLAVLFFPLNLEAAPRTSASVAGVKGYSSLAPVHGDTLLTVAVVVKVKPGWHVNAHRGLPEGFIPLTLSLAPGAPASLVDTRYPEGVKKALAGLPPFPVYQGSVTLFADLRLAEKLPLGP